MRTSTLVRGAVPALLALLATPALAEPDQNLRAEGGGLSSVPLLPDGLAFQLGGGVTGFTRESTRDLFGTGGYWDARAVYGTRSFIGAELAYVGSMRESQTMPGQDDTPYLVGNGVDLALRLNLPLAVGDVRLAPFAFGGVGWTYYQAVNQDARSTMKDGNALSIPFGGGLSAGYDRFTLDARFTYRSVFDDDLVPLSAGDREHADLQNWSVGLTLGYEI